MTANRTSLLPGLTGAPLLVPATAAASVAIPLSPAIPSGSGLAQHPFLDAGERDTRKTNRSMSLVRDGRIIWSASIPPHPKPGANQEFDAAALLPNRNTVVTNWCADDKNTEEWPSAGQVLVAAPGRSAVWAPRSWTDPGDRGPASSIQLPDEPAGGDQR